MTQVHRLAARGQVHVFYPDMFPALLADEAVLFQGDHETEPLVSQEPQVLHPGVPTIRRHQGWSQAPAEHFGHHLAEQVVLGFALRLVHHPKVDGHPHSAHLAVEERDQVDALDGLAVQAAVEVAHQFGLAFLAVGLVEHRVVHAQDAFFPDDERAHLLKQVPGVELFPIQETIGGIVGKLPAADFRKSHAAGTLRLRQEKGRVVFQRAFGGGGLGERPHKSADKIVRNLRLLNPHGA